MCIRDSKEKMLETIRYLNNAGIFGIKLQLLHVLENTDLAEDVYKRQVYNSAGYQEISAQGAKLTSGVIMTLDGAPIVPYYFSTSCGYTSDNLAWSGRCV